MQQAVSLGGRKSTHTHPPMESIVEGRETKATKEDLDKERSGEGR